MDYEKKYNEAMLRADEAVQKGCLDKDIFDIIFPPEESEDERIRKWLIQYIKDTHPIANYWNGAPTISDVLAWLEKRKESLRDFIDDFPYSDQQEQKPNIEICHHSIKSKSYKENGYPIENCDYGLEIALAILEKTLGEVQGYQTDDGLREHQTAIKAVKDAMKEQKPVGEQFPPLEGLDAIKAEYYDKGFKNGFDEGVDSVKPVEWSEEETKDLVHILKVLDDCYAYGKHDLSKTDHDNLTSTIKSLRPQWKPTEEQMEALQRAIDACESEWAYQDNELRSLLNDLQKL